MIGTLLSNRYRIDAQLGEGGMGVVYHAHDTLLDRPVAIKTLYESLFGEEGVKRLLREARAAAGLSHPNIVAVYDVIEDTRTHAIVMEFVRGKTLREFKSSLEQLAEITMQVLDALDHAHRQGIVHRDMKPENIMVTDAGTVKVMDFGLARSEGRSRLTQPGLVVGTVAYMAPEQALGGQLDGRTDLYALGCVLYELVTGRRPFESEDPISVISQHVSVPPVTPRWHNKNLPPDWEGFILRLLAKDPAERYPSAAEARRAVQALRPTALEETAVAEGEIPPAALLGRVQRGRLVARDSELRELKGFIDLAISGQGQMVTLAGEPGIGKTRLAREGQIYARLRGCRVMSGACYEQESGVPYLPYVEALQNYIKTRPASPVAEEVGDQGPELIKIVPDLGHIVPGLTPSPPLDPTHERLRLYDGVADFLLRISRTAPLVLFLDDLHWADGATLQLSKHLARRLRGERLLILGAYRDVELDRQHPLADVLREMNRERLYQRILLRRLDVEGVRAMIASMFGVEQDSDEFARLIHRETEGNPFFVEEVLKHLVETGAIYREEGRWGRKEIAEIEVPQSVKEVIGRRLEQVSETCRQTLTLAAVIGKRFEFDVLMHTADGNEDQVLDAIEEAIRSQLLNEEKVGAAVMYDFSHALIRETLYEGLSLRRRMRLHQRVGEALELVYRNREDEAIEDLAFHFARSAQTEVQRAVVYALRAAEKAQRIHAHEEALKFFGEAVDLLREAGRDAEAADVLEQMGEPAYYGTGDREKALSYYRQALAFQEKAGHRLRIAEVHRKIGRICHLSAAYAEAIPHLEVALVIFEKEGQPRNVAHTLLDLARARQFSGDFPGAEAHATRAREMSVGQGMPVEEAMASAELALSLQVKGKWDEADAMYLRAIRLCEGDDSTECRMVRRRSYGNMAGVATARGDLRKAFELYQHALQEAVAERNYPWMAIYRGFLAGHHSWAGEWMEARRLLKENLDPDRHAGPVYTQFARQWLRVLDGDWEGARDILIARLAEAEREQDVQTVLGIHNQRIAQDIDLEDFEAAIQWSRQALEAYRPYREYPGFGAGGLLVFATLGLALGDRLDEAKEALGFAERRVELLQVPLGRAFNFLARAVVEGKSGDWDHALESFGQSVSGLEAIGVVSQAAWARWILGRLLLAGDDPDRQILGRRLLGEALQTYERIGATRYVQEIQRRLAASQPSG